MEHSRGGTVQPFWRRQTGRRAIRRPRPQPIRIDLRPLRTRVARPRGPVLLIYGFAGLIVVGTILLMLPISTSAGNAAPFLDALFTATSAVCVTGLVVVNTGTYWSPFGQAVILVLIQVGGLGFMSMSTILLLLIGRRITFQERMRLREALGEHVVGGIVRLLRRIAYTSFAIELAGAALLYIQFSRDFPVLDAVWKSAFHSVSAFNNAGFDILSGNTSFLVYQSNVLMLGTLSVLIILGSISYTVLADFVKTRGMARLTLDSRLVVTINIFLWMLGAVVILLAEFTNESTLGPMPPGLKLVNAAFQSVVPRTPGFSSVDIGALREFTLFFMAALMFIGGASGSTAGGIKVNTLGVLLAAVWSAIRGRDQVEAFGRELPEDVVNRALAVVVLSLGLVFSAILLLSLTEVHAFIRILFEALSAFGTVGLTTGITPLLSPLGRLIIIVLMFAGRLGPLTVALALAEREEARHIRFAQERIKIG
ncbi:MAG: Trk family potassium uptake protein [Chloroflexi bacterium]|nr:Trk family potassium uptake protein [Chloroflexota bacterium]